MISKISTWCVFPTRWCLTFDPDQKVVQDIQSGDLHHCQRMGDRFAILDGSSEPRETQFKAGDRQNRAFDEAPLYPTGRIYLPDIGRFITRGFPSRNYLTNLDVLSLTEEMPCDEYDRISGLGNSSARLLKAQPVRLVPLRPHCGYLFAQRCKDRCSQSPGKRADGNVLELEIDFTDDELAELNDSGVNCLRAIRGGGIRVWGARTLSGQPQWSYVNVRRLFLTLTRWIRKNMDDVVYETNNPDLWDRVRRRLVDYCRHLFIRAP